MKIMKAGTRATIHNQNYSGEPIIEGVASLVSKDPDFLDDSTPAVQRWMVKFDRDEPGDPETFSRWVWEKDVLGN